MYRACANHNLTRPGQGNATFVCIFKGLPFRNSGNMTKGISFPQVSITFGQTEQKQPTEQRWTRGGLKASIRSGLLRGREHRSQEVGSGMLCGSRRQIGLPNLQTETGD